METKEKGGRTPFKVRAIAALIILILIFAVCFFYRSTLAGVFYGLRDFFKGSRQADELSYSNYLNSSYTGLNNGIASTSSRGIQVISAGGDQMFYDNFEMTSPGVDLSGERAAAFDIGGNIVKVFSNKEVLYTVETQSPVISASVNSSGWTAVCTQCEGYKGLVTVYDASGKVVYEWYSGEAYVAMADIREDSKTIAVLGMTESGSRIVFFDLGSEGEKGRCEIPDDVIIEIGFEKKDRVAAISAKKLLSVSTSGEIKKQYDFGSEYLRNYRLGSDGIHLLILSDYQVGGGCDAVCIRNGKETGRARNLPEPEKIALSGGKYALLSNQTVKVYSKNGKVKSTFNNISGAEEIILNDNGTVTVAKAYSAIVLR